NKAILQSMLATEKMPVNFFVETLHAALIEHLYHQLDTLAYALSYHDAVTTKLTTNNLLEYEHNHLNPWATIQFCFYVLDYLCDYLSIDHVTMSSVVDLSSGIEHIESIINKPLLDSQEENELVSKVKSYIINHYDEPISLSLIADILTVSPSYLSNLFHETVGLSYIKYLTDIRMKQAAMLLRDYPSMTLEEITKKVGYISVKHFSYVFKKHFAMTTSEYKSNFTSH
nr:AraC family transcriptional regulator [Vallitaleaceae bacterium]